MVSILRVALIAVVAETAAASARISGVASSEVARRRCFVCSGGGPEAEAWGEAPAHADKCLQIIVQSSTACGDLLHSDRVRSEKDERMRDAASLEATGTREAIAEAREKKLEVALLFNVLRKVMEKEKNELWDALFITMDKSTVELARHGSPEGANIMLEASKTVAQVRKPGLRVRRSSDAYGMASPADQCVMPDCGASDNMPLIGASADMPVFLPRDPLSEAHADMPLILPRDPLSELHDALSTSIFDV